MGQAYMAPSAQHVACCRKSNTMLRMHLAGGRDLRFVSSDAGFCLLFACIFFSSICSLRFRLDITLASQLVAHAQRHTPADMRRQQRGQAGPTRHRAPLAPAVPGSKGRAPDCLDGSLPALDTSPRCCLWLHSAMLLKCKSPQQPAAGFMRWPSRKLKHSKLLGQNHMLQSTG